KARLSRPRRRGAPGRSSRLRPRAGRPTRSRGERRLGGALGARSSGTAEDLMPSDRNREITAAIGGTAGGGAAPGRVAPAQPRARVEPEPRGAGEDRNFEAEPELQAGARRELRSVLLRGVRSELNSYRVDHEIQPRDARLFAEHLSGAQGVQRPEL